MSAARTAALMALLSIVLVVAGAGLGGLLGNWMAWTIGAFVFALLLNFASYWFSDKLALAMAGAKEVSREQEPDLHDLVESLAKKASLPKPKVYMIDKDSPNAFATGRSKEHAVVAVTRGLYRNMGRDELEGVLSHELAHIRNRDMLTMSIVATMVTTITFLASMARMAAIFGGMGRSRDDRNPLGGGGIIGIIVASILLPMAAMLVQLAISRTREFQADAIGARICGKPWALASALERLESLVKQKPMEVNPAVAHMFIVNPFKAQGVMGLFSTHPPIAERVRRLKAMQVQPL